MLVVSDVCDVLDVEELYGDDDDDDDDDDEELYNLEQRGTNVSSAGEAPRRQFTPGRAGEHSKKKFRQ